MRRAMRNKLRSVGGATVVFALVVFLIAAIFSAAMVAGASNAMRNSNEQYGQEQSYLSVASAAGLLRARVADDAGGLPHFVQKVEVEVKVAVYTDKDDPTEWDNAQTFLAAYQPHESGGCAPPAAYDLSAALTESGGSAAAYQVSQADKTTANDLMMLALQALWKGGGSQTLTIGAPDGYADKLSPVTAALTMDGDGNVTAALRSGGTPAYNTNVMFDCSPAVETDTRNYTQTHDEPIWDADGNKIGTYPVTDYTIDITVKTTTLTWRMGRVERGRGA